MVVAPPAGAGADEGAERHGAAREPLGRPGFGAEVVGEDVEPGVADGGEITCRPAAGEPLRWQRFLGGQVLPFAAVLQGLEVFHAGAVVVDGRALAVAAGSGVGKTSVTLELVRRGLPFLDDDVLAVDGDLLAHPGPGLANVKEGQAETRVAVPRHEDAVPLGWMVFLERGRAASLAVERPAPLDPRLLLAATFNLAIRTPERLARQLDVCGRIADSVAVLRAAVPDGVDATAVAERILDAARAQAPAPS